MALIILLYYDIYYCSYIIYNTLTLIYTLQAESLIIIVNIYTTIKQQVFALIREGFESCHS